MNILIIILLLSVVGCEARQARRAELPEIEKAKAVAVVAVARMDSPTPAPVQPVSDVCENCNGRGKVGDGVIMKTCRVCNGTGKKTNEQPVERSVLRTLNLDESILSDMRPQREWQVVVVGQESCVHCGPNKDAIIAHTKGVWTTEVQGDLGLGGLPTSDADIVFCNWEIEDKEIADKYQFPFTLVFEGAASCNYVKNAIGYFVGKHPPDQFIAKVNAALAKRKPQKSSQDFSAIPGGTIHAADEIDAALQFADKLLGRGGSITVTRPAGEVDAGQATIYFTGPTTIKIQSLGDKITATCEPAPRLQIRGVPILKPALSGITISKQSITLDLFRWPDVSIAVKESR